MPDLHTERAAIALYYQVLDLAEADRETWIERQCAEDPDLREHLHAMLEADRRATLRTGGFDYLDIAEAAPERIGAYRLIKPIGRGGMGSVYLGERDTGDFDHLVAIKIIKPGLLSLDLVERFQRERQILARLRHPHIAQLLDGGQTEAGAPFIVMEWVEGEPLLRWTEKRQSTCSERVDLFLAICSAVGFAHSHLIIHRDLTPSNVLVTAAGVIKLIDFGISKPATRVSEGHAVDEASLGALSLTPGYAAPERRFRTDVATTTDIYSLGRIAARLFQDEKSDRDLAAIVSMATADDPDQRYATVDALARDIRQWHHRLPVAARGGGLRYRADKFIRRHWQALGSAGIAVVLLIAALIGTSLALDRAQSARKAENARFEQLRRLAHYLLFEHLDRLGRVVGTVDARVQLADQAQGYLAELARSPRAGAAIRLEAATGFNRLARLRGVPVGPNLGQHELARANLSAAIKLLTPLIGDHEEAKPQLAIAFSDRAMIELYRDHRAQQAEASLAKAAALLETTASSARGANWLRARSDLLRARLALSIMAADYGSMRKLARLMEREAPHLSSQTAGGLRRRTDEAIAAFYNAFATSQGENQSDAVALYRSAENQFAALLRDFPEDPFLLYWLSWNDYLASGLATGVGNSAEGRRFLDVSQTIANRLIAIEPYDIALINLQSNLMRTRAQQFDAEGRYARAIALQRQVLEREERHLDAARASTTLNAIAFELTVLGRFALHAGDDNLTCNSWAKALDLYETTQGRGELTDYYAYYPPRLAANLKFCSGNAPTSRMTDFD